MVFSPFAAKFPSEDEDYAVVVDDDGKVGYAYILDADGQILGDVWIYNRCATPQEPEWFDRTKAPFANSVAYTNEALHLPCSVDDISVEWSNQGVTRTARIYIQKTLAAILMVGEKPGWATLARKDGPLARVLRQ